MRILIKEQQFDIDENSIKNTFFEALNTSNMNTDLDLEAYEAYILQTLNYEKYEELQDKYLLNKNNIIKFALDIIAKNNILYIDIDIALRYKYYDIIPTIIKKTKNFDFFKYSFLIFDNIIDVNTQDKSGNTIFHDKNIYKNKSDLFDVFDFSKFNINIQNNDGYTILHILASNNFAEYIIKLLNYIDDFNICDSSGNTFAHTLTYYNNTITIECLSKVIDIGKLDYNKKNIHKETFLSLCCKKNYYDLIIKLINTNKCHYNIPDNYGNTPFLNSLYFFVENEKYCDNNKMINCIKTFLQTKKVNKYIKNDKCKNCYEIALKLSKENQKIIIDLLNEY